MAYTKNTWVGSTVYPGYALSRLENGLEAAAAVADTANAATTGAVINAPWFATTLAAPTAWGDTTISTAGGFGSFTDVRQGVIVIDPWTSKCEARRSLLTGGTSPFTLQAQRGFTPTKTQITASTKTFRWFRTITSISVAANVATIVWDAPVNFVAGDFLQIWGTTSYNNRYVGPVSTVAGDKLSCTLPWYQSAPATETAGSVSRYSHRHFSLNFKVGEKFKLTGSVAGNNGTYTCATINATHGSITVSEAVPANENGDTLVYGWDIQQVHASGATVLYIPQRQLNAQMYGLNGDGTDEGSQLQKAFWDVGAIGAAFFLSNRTYSTGIPLCCPQMTLASNHGQGTIGELGNASGGGVGLLNTQTTAGVVGGLNRLYMRDIRLAGNASNTSGIGCIMSTQQPNNWMNVRIDTFGAEGLVLRGQQGAFSTLEILHGAVAGITFEGAILFNFFDLDIEIQTGGAMMRNPAGTGNAHANRIYGFHSEHGAAVTLYDCTERGTCDIALYGGLWSPTGAGSKGIYYHPSDTTQKGIQYTVRDFYINSSTDFPFIDDVSAGISLGSYNFFRQYVDVRRVAMPQNQTTRNATTQDIILGPQGQQVRFGADLGFSSLMQMVQPDANTGDFIQCDGSTITGLFRVNKDGFVIVKKNAAPADADLAANEMAVWFDPTNGAGKFMVKAKQADGTVKTGSFNVQT